MKRNLLVSFMFLMLLTCLPLPFSASAAIPQKVNYQGYLKTATGVPLTGEFQIVFSIYNTASDGTPLWTESQNVLISNGIYNVILGETTSISSGLLDGDRYLGVTIGADSEMMPRTMLSSVPFAIKAMSATSADTAASAEISTDFRGSLAGDVTGSQSATSVTKIQGKDVAPTTPSSGQVLKWTGSAWAPSADNDTISGNPSYIQNQSATGQAASFNISGTGTVGGNMNVSGAVSATSYTGSGAALSGVTKPHVGAVYRWAEFDTYAEGSGWLAGNSSYLTGGVNPSAWTDGSALASSMSSDKEVLRTLFTQKGYAGKNALINAKVFYQYSSTNGHVTLALFRIKNTTLAAINWTPNFWYTANAGWSERASAALNGASRWDSGVLNTAEGATAAVMMSIPPNRTSTVIFVSPSGYNGNFNAYGFIQRNNLLAFYNNSLALPAGLEYVDDLDTATGGWEQ